MNDYAPYKHNHFTVNCHYPDCGFGITRQLGNYGQLSRQRSIAMYEELIVHISDSHLEEPEIVDAFEEM